MSKIAYLKSNNIYLNHIYRKYGNEVEVNTTHFMPVLFKNTDVSIANALRRICTSEIDNLAFASIESESEGERGNERDIVDTIEIVTNTSQYQNDVLIDRFGFIILNMEAIERAALNPNDMRFYICDPIDPEKSLKNETNKVMKVTVHNHLKMIYNSKPMEIRDICPYDSLLMTLNHNEEILVKMTPTIGNGMQHSRWQSSVTMYKFATLNDLETEREHLIRPVIQFIEKIQDGKKGDRYITRTTEDQFKANYIYEFDGEKWVETVPNVGDTFQMKDGPSFTYTSLKEWRSNDYVETNDEQQKYIGFESKVPESILLTIETIGKFRSITVLQRAIQMLKTKLVTIMNNMRQWETSSKVIPEFDTTLSNFVKFKILDEDHTIGQVLEYACLIKIRQLVDQHVQKLKEDDFLNIFMECLSGYRKTHPLEKFIELIIRTPKSCDLPIPDEYHTYPAPIAVVILSIIDMIKLCDELAQDASGFK
jgi:hypothetical protein